MDKAEEAALEVLEEAPPYPGHPLDYGHADRIHQPAYHSSPYPTVPVGYTAYPEPGLHGVINNPYYQGGPNPGMYPPATTVTTTVMLPSLSDLPGQIMCPHCKHQVITITDHYSGLMTWMACGCLALIGCWPCCLVPFWMDSCKDVEHRCPKCNNMLSFYKRL